MKKSLLPVLLIPFLLASCGEQRGPGNGSASTSQEEETSTSISETDENDFTLQFADNGLIANRDPYLFSRAEDGDEYPPEANIVISADVSSWAFCTAVDEKATGVYSEDEAVIPEEALLLDTMLDSDIHGSSGSSEIIGFTISIDRKMVNPGTTKVLFTTRPSNGSSSIAKDTRICVEVDIVAYGSIDIATCEVDINFDPAGLEEALSDIQYDTVEFCLSDSEEIYGSNALAHYRRNIEPGEMSDPVIGISGLDLASGHMYDVWIYAEGKDDRRWLPLDGEGGVYVQMGPNDNGLDSYLEVTNDATINCQLA